VRWQCGNCDNCLLAPATWDATEAARKALSCIYRFGQSSWGPRSFGAGHLIDVLRGKATDKVAQFEHTRLSTYGIGADVSEVQWRGVLRQLIALGHVRTEGEYNTLVLTESAREVLRGAVPVRLRVANTVQSRTRPAKTVRTRRFGAAADGGAAMADDSGRSKTAPSAAATLDATAAARFDMLRAWRAEVARAHNLPAYVVFHDATLAQMAAERPASLEALAAISGVGSKKLLAYGEELLRLLAAPAQAS
jgi:ATP-dependent DNA helicase RecQ